MKWPLKVILPNGKVWDKEFGTLLHMLNFQDIMLSVGFKTVSNTIVFPSLIKKA